MHVAVDATPLLGARTGIGVFTHEVIHHLAQDPTMHLRAFPISWRGRDTLADQLPATVEVVTRPLAARPLMRAWQRADHPTIEWWTGAVDVVFGPNFVVPPARRAAEVMTVHDLTCVRFPEMCTDDVLRFPDCIRRALRRGAWVHTVSDAVADEVREHFDVPAERVVTVPNGVSPLAPDAPGADAATGRRLAGSDRYVLGLGTIEPRKDFPALVAAFDDLAADDPDLHLVIAGPDGWGLDAYVTAVDRAHHRDRIVRFGWIDDAARAALLRGASAFAFPSRYEGFGLPPLEAMLAGTPTVTTSAGGLASTVGDAAVVVAPGDPVALAAALHDVLRDDALRADLVARGHERTEALSWAATAAGLRGVFAAAIAAHGGRRR